MSKGNIGPTSIKGEKERSEGGKWFYHHYFAGTTSENRPTQRLNALQEMREERKTPVASERKKERTGLKEVNPLGGRKGGRFDRKRLSIRKTGTPTELIVGKTFSLPII